MTTLVARLDNVGDVLLAGPAVRAVAAGAGDVVLLASPHGAPAADLLPGVAEVLTCRAPWIEADAPPVDARLTAELVRGIEARGIDEAVVLTSWHQSALPLALLLRLAGVERIAAISDDYPGSLLDVRHRVPDDIHEVQRGLSLALASGYPLPSGDDGRLRIAVPAGGPVPSVSGGPGYVVVHPGASVPARTWAAERFAAVVDGLRGTGQRVVVTGGAGEADLCRLVAGPAGDGVEDLAGALDLGGLAAVLAGAAAVVVGNTGPAHLAAAVGTPVVSIFPPTVPAVRWRPWGVRHVVLGDQAVPCAGCRARSCPVPGQPCLARVTVSDVLAAVDAVASRPEVAGEPRRPRSTRPRGVDPGIERTHGNRSGERSP